MSISRVGIIVKMEDKCLANVIEDDSTGYNINITLNNNREVLWIRLTKPQSIWAIPLYTIKTQCSLFDSREINKLIDQKDNKVACTTAQLFDFNAIEDNDVYTTKCSVHITHR